MSRLDEARALLAKATMFTGRRGALLALVADLEADAQHDQERRRAAMKMWREARRQLAEATEWRDMESAPRDGREVLLCERDSLACVVARWDGTEWTSTCRYGEYFNADDSWYVGYLPIPAPPTPAPEDKP